MSSEQIAFRRRRQHPPDEVEGDDLAGNSGRKNDMVVIILRVEGALDTCFLFQNADVLL